MEKLSIRKILEIIVHEKLLILLLLFISYGCNNTSNAEEQAIDFLNQNNENYFFKSANDLVGVHLEIYIDDNDVDSIELMKVFDSTIEFFKDSLDINWVYLTVYDEDKGYIFTLSKTDGKYSFFKDNYN